MGKSGRIIHVTGQKGKKCPIHKYVILRVNEIGEIYCPIGGKQCIVTHRSNIKNYFRKFINVKR